MSKLEYINKINNAEYTEVETLMIRSNLINDALYYYSQILDEVEFFFISGFVQW